MSSFRCAVFDLDDTLLRDDLSISAYTVEVFRRLRASGFCFIAASGRTRMSMKPFVDQLGCVSLCISCNGAEIWNPAEDTVLSREVFPTDLYREITRFGKKYRVYAQTYSDDRFYFNEYSEYSRRYAAASRLAGEYVGDLEAFSGEPRGKILMMADEEKIAAMQREAWILFEGRASVACSKPYFLEFTPLRATKGIALGKAAALLGIPLEAVVAFGDSINDLSMLQVAGRSVAVANARPEILSACDAVCPSNQEDGVAHYLDSSLFSEEVSS